MNEITSMVSTLFSYFVLWLLALFTVAAASRIIFSMYFSEKAKFLQTLAHNPDSAPGLLGLKANTGIQ